ncbi:hypothetical protein PHSC3_001740 [Chlamydiales bacterium STE3]|nr:hypothetical protein PHSC3_001740 [Chlamydiales bacterium STE3]
MISESVSYQDTSFSLCSPRSNIPFYLFDIHLENSSIKAVMSYYREFLGKEAASLLPRMKTFSHNCFVFSGTLIKVPLFFNKRKGFQ